MANPEPLIALKDVHLTLTSRAGPVHILRGISLEIPQGQTVAILGPSGSGKTSLLMVMAGLESATRGEVHVAGRELSRLNQDELSLLRGEHIGIVFQSFHLVPTMTALENIALPLELAQVPGPEATARQLIADVSLTERGDHFPAELSGGEQQRVAIARALSRRPKLILADEPTGNLDGKTGKQIIDLLFGLKEKTGATLVLVTHDEHLADLAERKIRMADGSVVADERAHMGARAAAR